MRLLRVETSALVLLEVRLQRAEYKKDAFILLKVTD